MPQPGWLQSSLQETHCYLALRTLSTRETQRDVARNSSSSSTHYSPKPSSSTIIAYYSRSVGRQTSNRHKNRYFNLEAYDRTRVIVPTSLYGVPGDIVAEPRYLNANWVRESAGGKWWIAGQAPLPNTIHAFLTLAMCPAAPSPVASAMSSSMVPPMRRVHTIVQLTQLIEGHQQRAHPYFCGIVGQSMTFYAEDGCDAPPIHVFVDSSTTIDDAQCVRTELRLRWGDESASPIRDRGECTVTHLLYTAWPDFGVPRENGSILRFLQLVERVNNRHTSRSANDPNASPPILAHCSAGVGRTGSFIALSSLLRAYSLLSSSSPSVPPSMAPPLPTSPLGPLPQTLDDDLVVKEIDSLREQRQSMVQKNEQAIWVYRALADAFQGI